MARLCSLVLVAASLLETYALGAVIADQHADSVFVSQERAATVLRRQRRYNSGVWEEIGAHKDNLERECIEEVCNMEEAREVFENDEKTMEFWAGYIDGDQCKSSPCQNGAVCKDGVNAYLCFCQPNFNGKNCEIELAKQCSLNNGGCSHFCVMQNARAVCQCAFGYTLGADRKHCQPTGQFPCGRLSAAIISASNSGTTAGALGKTRMSDADLDHDDADYDFNQTLHYTDYELPTNDSDLSTSADGATVRPEMSNSSSRSALLPLDVGNGNETEELHSDAGENPELPRWAFYPTLPTITAEENQNQRIVGGNEATPGEIPWQVTIMTVSKRKSFCGGSLLSEVWVITAAHCLHEAAAAATQYFVRVGEHDISQSEGNERDHMVAEEFIHPAYSSKKSLYNHDIALLKLTNPVELSDHRLPICLGPKDFTENLLRDSSSSLVSGWGRMDHRGMVATVLQKLEVPYVDRTACKSSSQDHITRFMFCAGYHSEQKDSCQGDSGGPHATNYQGTWFLTGIVSWGEDCAMDGKYGIYTRISRYYNWISQITGIRINNSTTRKL